MTKKTGNVVFLRTKDESLAIGPGWELVKPADVPAELRDPDTLGYLLIGQAARIAGSPWSYTAVEIDEDGIPVRHGSGGSEGADGDDEVSGGSLGVIQGTFGKPEVE